MPLWGHDLPYKQIGRYWQMIIKLILIIALIKITSMTATC